MIIRYLIPYFMRGDHYTTILGRTMKTRTLIIAGILAFAGFKSGILQNPINVDKLASYISYKDSDKKEVDTKKTRENLSKASGFDKLGEVTKTVWKSIESEGDQETDNN